MITKVLALFLTLLPFSFVSPVFAQYIGATITQPARQLLVEKKILNPQNNQFVDNLNLEQQTFLPNQEVTFRVTITNIIQSDLRNIVVTDRLPDALNFISTSFGSYDSATKTITLKIDSLKVGESKTFEIKAKIKPAEELSNNVTCQTNLARGMVNNLVEEDTASFCIQKQVLQTTPALPTTGPAQTLEVMVLSTLFLAIGLLTKRIIILEGR